MSSCLVDYRFYSVKRDFLCFGMLINYRLIVYSFSTIRVVKKLWSLHTSPVAHQAGTYLRFLQYEVTRNNTIPWVGCQSTSGFHLAFHWPCSTMGGRERHCESKVSCPRTQRIVTGQGLNPNHSILVVASAITFRQSILLKLWLLSIICELLYLIIDTIPGRQCMASCFFLLKQFEDVLIYLNSIKVRVAGDHWLKRGLSHFLFFFSLLSSPILAAPSRKESLSCENRVGVSRKSRVGGESPPTSTRFSRIVVGQSVYKVCNFGIELFLLQTVVKSFPPKLVCVKKFPRWYTCS